MRPVTELSEGPDAGVPARKVAIDALVRIDAGGAYANLVLPELLERSGLERRDRAFVTELVYGTTRMRRGVDWLVDRFLLRPVDPPVRAPLRVGAYQLVILGTPAHAAVSATVGAVPGKVRGLVNAVLRRVADAAHDWPDPATALSYPDWIIERLSADLGAGVATEALAAMNRPAPVTERADGYTQDLASQWVAELVGAEAGDRVADVCAAPGGKATALAAAGAVVVAPNGRPSRARLVAENATRVLPAGATLVPVVADGRPPPFPPASFDRVLVDPPCTGLGALPRRADARWRIEPEAADRLAELQRELLVAALGLVRPGGVLVYSVCTLVAPEATAHDEWVAAEHPGWEPLPPPGEPWQPWGRGALLLPQAADTDGMALFRWRRPPANPRS